MTSRLTKLVVAATLGLAVLTGCGENSSTDCGIDECTVTFNRGVEASASVLGVDAKLISANGESVTVEIAGEELTLTVGQQGTDVAGLKVYLDSVTDSQVAIRISRF